MLTAVKQERILPREMRKLPIRKRAAYLCRTALADSLCDYHPDDPFPGIVKEIPDILIKWTRSDRLRDVPGAVAGIIKEWKRQKTED